MPTLGLTKLTARESHELLRSQPIGRVIVTLDALPAAFPVNFKVVDDCVVVRTASGTKLEAALAGTVVGFEVDQFNTATNTGWSVLVVGVATVVDDPDEVAALEAHGIRSWLGEPLPHFIRIKIETISGRTVGGQESPRR
jgi:nitroimidazol reductase NimA-like FMN-containing flavoprotein (pyridoxamine 5'-phosphate oxidase superfamily)